MKTIPSRRGVLGIFGLAALLVVAGAGLQPGGSAPPPPEPQTPAAQGVRLVIDYADGAEKHFVALTYRPGMTVLDLMEQAKAHARGISYEQRGKGITAFLTKIDDLENEGGGAGRRNWQFFINGQRGKQGFGAAEVREGETVTWAFKPLEPARDGE